MAQVSQRIESSLLCSFAPVDRERLLSVLEPVPMPLRTPLFEPGKQPRYVHFMTSGAASIVAETRLGEAVEVSLIGREGIPESLHLLGLGPEAGVSRCFIQAEGTALRMSFGKFQEIFLENEAVRKHVLRFVQYQALVTGQLAACNKLHSVEERLARWLLMVTDRIGSEEIGLTQQFLGEMLGTRRSTVTLSAGVLQQSGLIQYHRGKLRILDRDKLQMVACECLGVAQGLLRSLYP